MGLGGQLKEKTDKIDALTNPSVQGSAKADVAIVGFNKMNIDALKSIPDITETELSDIRTTTTKVSHEYIGKEKNKYKLVKPLVPNGPEYPNREVNYLVTEKMWRIVCL